MSEDYIQLPPDSMGKRIRALKRNIAGYDVYERVVLLSEPASGELLFRRYPTYSACLEASSVAANKHHLIIFNGSSSIIRITRIIISPVTTAAVTGYLMGYRLRRISTAGSGGTAITVNKMDTSDPDLPSGVTVWSNPTTAPSVGVAIACGSVNPEETGGGSTIVPLYEWKIYEKPLTLRNNEGITVQQYGTAGVGLIDIYAVFQVIQ